MNKKYFASVYQEVTDTKDAVFPSTVENQTPIVHTSTTASQVEPEVEKSGLQTDPVPGPETKVVRVK